MTTKFLEIRDRNTCIPALAFDISGADGPIARRAGWTGDGRSIYLISLVTQRAAYDPYSGAWGDARTLKVAHQWLDEHFDEVQSGAVVDVRVILGETTEPAAAECR